MAEQVVAEHILPLPVVGKDKPDTDDAAWTDRLLLTMGHLDEKAVNGLLAQTNLKGARPSAHERFVQACVDNNASRLILSVRFGLNDALGWGDR
jgi:sister-chromatid-cohesion protein PDS5